MDFDHNGMSRRSFLTATAAMGAVATLGLAGCGNSPKSSTPQATETTGDAPYPPRDFAGRLSMSDFE